jgi:hypothetical protein
MKAQIKIDLKSDLKPEQIQSITFDIIDLIHLKHGIKMDDFHVGAHRLEELTPSELVAHFPVIHK